MMNWRNFEELSSKIELSNSGIYEVRLEMGGNLIDELKRINQVIERCNNVFDYLFDKNSVFVKLIIWDAGTHKNFENLINSGFDLNQPDLYTEINDNRRTEQNLTIDDRFFYLYYKDYSFHKFHPLLVSTASYELAVEPCSNISCKYFCFNGDSLLVNLYDDRGMKILFDNKSKFERFKEKYKEFVI